jgi:hypothetical protein
MAKKPGQENPEFTSANFQSYSHKIFEHHFRKCDADVHIEADYCYTGKGDIVAATNDLKDSLDWKYDCKQEDCELTSNIVLTETGKKCVHKYDGQPGSVGISYHYVYDRWCSPKVV